MSQTSMHSIINRNELRVIGMSRSGNHAIINWIVANLKGSFCFLNCAEPKTNPFDSARPLPGGKPYRSNTGSFFLDGERQGRLSAKDYLIYSHEDCFLGSVNNKAFEKHHDTYVGPSARRLDILILRDPFNLFASRRQAMRAHDIESKSAMVPPRMALRIWKQHARELSNLKRYLSQPRVLINYNRWTAESTYRRQLANELGLASSEAGLHRVAGCAGGSSFDGLRFRERASEMRVLERWQHFADDVDYWKLFDTETLHLTQRIFGQLPASKRLRGCWKISNQTIEAQSND